jgi:hypothetical protein
VARHVTGGRIVAEVVETESVRRSNRPELRRPGRLPGSQGQLADSPAGRLARNVAFIASLMETSVPFVACDMLSATPFMLHVYAAMGGGGEGDQRPNEGGPGRRQGPRRNAWQPLFACQQCRAGAYGCGGEVCKAWARAADLRPVIAEVRTAGIDTLTGVAKALTARGVPTPSGRGT